MDPSTRRKALVLRFLLGRGGRHNHEVQSSDDLCSGSCGRSGTGVQCRHSKRAELRLRLRLRSRFRSRSAPIPRLCPWLYRFERHSLRWRCPHRHRRRSPAARLSEHRVGHESCRGHGQCTGPPGRRGERWKHRARDGECGYASDNGEAPNLHDNHNVSISLNGDNGADPNKLVKVTDQLSATQLSTNGYLDRFVTIRSARAGEAFRGVALAPVDGR
jgi:hypothetical protein